MPDYEMNVEEVTAPSSKIVEFSRNFGSDISDEYSKYYVPLMQDTEGVGYDCE